MLTELGVVLCVSSSAITLTGIVAFGYARMFHASQKENSQLRTDLSEALKLSTAAQGMQLQAERNLADFKNQMAEWLKKPVTVNWVMTPEQIDQLASNIKKTPEPPRFN